MSEVAQETQKPTDQIVTETGAEKLYGENQQPEATKEDAIEAKAEGQESTGQDAKPGEESKQESKSTTDELPSQAEPELELDLKEGLTDADVNEVKAFAKEHKISKEAAQKILDQRSDLGKKFRKQETENLKNAMESWVKAAKADPEIGGDNFDKSVALARTTVQKIDKDFFGLLDSTGLGNHPQLIRFLARVGKQMSPEGFVSGGSNPAPRIEPKHALYGND